MRSVALLMFVVVVLAGCAATNTDRINEIQLGMTRAEVIDAIGQPDSTSAKGNTEYLNYIFDRRDGPFSVQVPHFVRLIDGTVESFGKTGDFDSTKPATVRVETDENIRVNADTDLYTELRKLKGLHDDGIITDAEYDELKRVAIQKY